MGDICRWCGCRGGKGGEDGVAGWGELTRGCFGGGGGGGGGVG